MSSMPECRTFEFSNHFLCGDQNDRQQLPWRTNSMQKAIFLDFKTFEKIAAEQFAVSDLVKLDCGVFKLA
jgi:hypothetical protein